ncbi:MAG: family 20 glycosylhydrolase [Candidatus Krumholzibacteriia bacterium]
MPRWLVFMILVFGSAAMAQTPPLPPLVPWPQEVAPTPGVFTVDASTAVLLLPATAGLQDRVDAVLAGLRRGTGLPLAVLESAAPHDHAVNLDLDRALDAEAYTLQITPSRVTITAGGPDALGWALQTLRQLLPAAAESALPAIAPDPGREGGLRPLPDGVRYARRNVAPAPAARPEPLDAARPAAWTLPCLRIADHPSFAWRGVLLDCCRHFIDVPAIERLLDLMALHKLNRLHWHLTEDQGWRLQIRSRPELTTVAAWRRDADGARYGGFYTQDQARHVVAYAAARGITVVPEIELPGHAQAALAAYPELSCRQEPLDVQACWGVWPDVYCAGNEAVFRFLDDVLTEVLDIFPSEFIHIGGDECPKDRWRECPRCQARIEAEGLRDEHHLQSWFVGRMERWLAARGRRLVGWDEILEGGLPQGATVQSWRGLEGAVAAARQGHDTIVSPTSHCYLDADIGVTDLATAHGFFPVPPELSAAERAHVLGGEMNLWTEYAPQAVMDERLFPRLCGLAEALWSDRERPGTDFDSFWSRFLGHRVRLDRLGVRRAYEGRPVRLTARWEPGADGWRVRWAVDGALPAGRRQVRLDLGGASELVELAGQTLVHAPGAVTAQVLVDGEAYGAPWRVDLARHLAVGAAYECEPWPLRDRYRPEEPHAALDGVLPDVEYEDGRWLAWEGPDAVVTVDLGRPQPVREVSALCLHGGGRLNYSPEQVAVSVSDDGRTWREFGADGWRLAPEVFARTLRTYTVRGTPHTARWVRVRLEQRRNVPAWPWAPLSPPWMFLGQIVVR